MAWLEEAHHDEYQNMKNYHSKFVSEKLNNSMNISQKLAITEVQNPSRSFCNIEMLRDHNKFNKVIYPQ